MMDSSLTTPDRSPLTRLTWLVAALLLFVIVAAAVAGSQSASILPEAAIDSLVLAGWVVAAWGCGCVVARSLASVASEDRVLAHVTRIALGLGVLSLAAMMLGTSGLLNRPITVGLLAIGVGIAIAHIYANRNTTLAWWRGRLEVGSLASLLAMVPLAIMVVGAFVLPGVLWGADDPAGYDVVAYHLQMPREWCEAGRVITLARNVFSFMPLNVEMQYLLAMHLRGGAFAGMYLAQLMHGAFIALTVAAVYGALRSRGALAASVGAMVCACMPWSTMLGSVAYNEGGLMLYATLSAVWALRGRWGLAGACAGLAAGCKLTGVTAAIVLVPISIMLASGPLLLWERTRVRARLNNAVTETDDRFLNASDGPEFDPLSAGEETRFGFLPSLQFGVLALLTFSPWLVRTAIATHGNPIFPLAMNVLGSAHFDGGQVARFEAAHAPRPDQQSIAGRLAALWHQVGGDAHFGSIALGGVSIPLMFVLLVVAALLMWRDRASRVWTLLIIGNVLIWLFATHLQGRFLAHAVPLIALVIGCAACKRSAASRGFAAAAIVISLVGFVLGLPFATLEKCLVTAGLPEPTELQKATLPPAVAAAIYGTQRPLILVGDAKAFWYAVPQARLTYHSVFDVPSDVSFVDAWVGRSPPADALVVVDPAELARFARTYKNLPPVPDAWRDRQEPFVVDVRSLTHP